MKQIGLCQETSTSEGVNDYTMTFCRLRYCNHIGPYVRYVPSATLATFSPQHLLHMNICCVRDLMWNWTTKQSSNQQVIAF